MDINSIKRQIYLNGVIDISNKILYSQFLDTFLDYISELNSFINLPLIFQEQNKITKKKIKLSLLYKTIILIYLFFCNYLNQLKLLHL